MNTREINERMDELSEMCDADDRHDYVEQLKWWIYTAEGKAAALEVKMSCVLAMLLPSMEAFEAAQTDYEASIAVNHQMALYGKAKTIAEASHADPRD